MSQRLRCSLDQFSGIRLRKRHTQILSGRLPRGLFARLNHCGVMSFFGEGVQMSDQSDEILVGNVWFKPQAVLESDGKRENEIYRSTADRVRG